VSRKGNSSGGKQLSRGALYHLLSNPVYVGEIRHKQARHPGQHKAIVTREVWDQVQRQLRSRTARSGAARKTAAEPSPLAGKLFDESGTPLYVQGAVNGKRRYRYYVSRALVRGDSHDQENGWRISAPEIESAIAAAVRQLLNDRAAIALALEERQVDADQFESVLRGAGRFAEKLRHDDDAKTVLVDLVERVNLMPNGIQLSVNLPLAPHGLVDRPGTLLLSRAFPVNIRRRGNETRLVLPGEVAPTRVDLPLLRAVARARAWAQELMSGKADSMSEVARKERIDSRSVTRLLPLAFLAPAIVDAIAEGRQSPDLTVYRLSHRVDLPMVWKMQERALGLQLLTVSALGGEF